MGKILKAKIQRSFFVKVAREQLGLIAASYSFFPGVVTMKTTDEIRDTLIKIDFPSSASEAMSRDLNFIAKDLKKSFAANLK